MRRFRFRILDLERDRENLLGDLLNFDLDRDRNRDRERERDFDLDIDFDLERETELRDDFDRLTFRRALSFLSL